MLFIVFISDGVFRRFVFQHNSRFDFNRFGGSAETFRVEHDFVQTMKVVTLRSQVINALLQFLMLENFYGMIAVNEQAHLFAGRHRARINVHRFERHDAFFRRSEILFLSLAEPQRTQAERVATEYDFVAFARDDRGGALRHRTERAAEVTMKVFHRRIEFFGFAPHGREDDFERFHQRQAVIEHQAFDDAVKNLRVARVARQLKAERNGFAREAVNRVDFAVVAERRKHLRFLSR